MQCAMEFGPNYTHTLDCNCVFQSGIEQCPTFLVLLHDEEECSYTYSHTQPHILPLLQSISQCANDHDMLPSEV